MLTIESLSEEIGEVRKQLSTILEQTKLLVERQTVREWYSPEDFAKAVGRAEKSVREWCRFGRINAKKRNVGTGGSKAWGIAHSELLRYQRDGLLPDRRLKQEEDFA